MDPAEQEGARSSPSARTFGLLEHTIDRTRAAAARHDLERTQLVSKVPSPADVERRTHDIELVRRLRRSKVGRMSAFASVRREAPGSVMQ